MFILIVVKKSWILVVDSGLGGLWTLEKIRKILPSENYLYFMDRAHAPYGNKSNRNLIKILHNNLDNIFAMWNIKLVVIACNTLSMICYESITKIFPQIPFVKVEPIFSQDELGHQQTLLLATNSPIKNLRKKRVYKNCLNIKLKGFGKLAKTIDESKGKFSNLDALLTKKLKKYAKFDIKNVILGCTHYNYIRNNLVKIFGNVMFFENSETAAKNVLRLLCSINKKSKAKKHGEILNIYKV